MINSDNNVTAIKILISLCIAFIVGITMLMRMGYNLEDTSYIVSVLGSFFGTYLILSTVV